ncbi:MAG TPA: serine hydrolase domain-containing protein [Steroidobacteraceae bacterium]|nr:serine hydrolase domain-containing protein [Steroidobacteraceae bacterium]
MRHSVKNHRVLALVAAMLAVAFAGASAAQEAIGEWVGGLELAPGNRLPLLVHIKRNAAGALNGTMDSPSQGANGLPLGDIKADAGSLSFTVSVVGGSYKGQWLADGKLWRGEWSQAGQHWPLALVTAPPPRPLPADWQLPPDADIAKLIADRNAPRPGQAIVIGLVGPDGQRFVTGGTSAAAAVDRNTLFEIGSISKVFTALLLADMVNRHEVSLDDPAAKYLPASHHMPERGGRQITLRELSTHRSGLPRMPDDMGRADGVDNPFEGYGEDKLLAFLDRYKLTRDIDAQWEYSNLGVGLLGYLLGRAAHTNYETLLRQRITGPLGMKNTLISLSPRDAARLAAPFDRFMRPAKQWDINLFAGAGGIRSSAADMVTFAKALLDSKSPIAAAVKTALSVRVQGEAPQVDQALGFEVFHPEAGREILLHNGQTGGYQAMLVAEPAKGRAVVALSNSQAQPSPDDIALHILIGTGVLPTPPVPSPPPPPTQHTEISLPPETLDKIVGRYDFGPGFTIAVTRDGATLRVLREGVPSGQPLPIYSEGPLAFFWKALDAQIRFTTDTSGMVTGAELKQGSAIFTGTRVPE